jgi:hypothetical protein
MANENPPISLRACARGVNEEIIEQEEMVPTGEMAMAMGIVMVTVLMVAWCWR